MIYSCSSWVSFHWSSAGDVDIAVFASAGFRRSGLSASRLVVSWLWRIWIHLFELMISMNLHGRTILETVTQHCPRASHGYKDIETGTDVVMVYGAPISPEVWSNSSKQNAVLMWRRRASRKRIATATQLRNSSAFTALCSPPVATNGRQRHEQLLLLLKQLQQQQRQRQTK